MAMLVSTIVDEVEDTIRSYTRDQNASTALTSSMTSGTLSFTVADASRVAIGLVEIEDEMVQVRSVDKTTNTIVLEPWGRARSGTTADVHGVDARLTSAPSYPRGRTRDLVSGVMQEVFPSIFAVNTTTLTYNPAQNLYALPSDCYHVLQVQHQPPGPSLSWHPVHRWRQNKTPTTVELDVLSWVVPGSNRVRVLYVKNPPGQLVLTDDLEALGYPTTIRDVIVLGASARLTGIAEAARTQTRAVFDSAARGDFIPPGSAMNLSRYLYQMFRQRLEDEARNLQMRYPYFAHFAR